MPDTWGHLVDDMLAPPDMERPPTTMSNGSQMSSDSGYADVSDEEELELVGHSVRDCTDSDAHELKTAPVMTRRAYLAAGGEEVFPQRGLLGTVVESSHSKAGDTSAEAHSRIYVNTNAPLSALVCGVQGSGKSHTVSILLENMLIPHNPAIGRLSQALSGLVLHFGSGGADSQASEAAYISTPLSSTVKGPRVMVYVSPSSLKTMRAVYAKVKPDITVEPLQFGETELDAKAFLSLMAVGSSDSAPLYMQTVLSILRELGEYFTYDAFKRKLEIKKERLNPTQLSGLAQRMELLETFLDKRNKTMPSRFAAGQLTIVDLSDIFIDPNSACGLFEIVVRLFVRAKLGTGKVLVVDEAHKYLSASGKRESGLTKELSSLVRQQRHLGMRVIISTQEPNVVPDTLLDLCTVTIMHRFSSPSWWEHISKHVSADMSSGEAFDRVVRLQTGQAILLAPSGLAGCTTRGDRKELDLYGRRWTVVKTRKRVTHDGGASVLVVGA